MSSVHVVPLRDGMQHLVPGGLAGHGTGCPCCLRGRWLVIEATGSDVADDACPCAPTPEHVPNTDGPDGWLHTHHSLDGRELQENR